jgi:hypothetical protein
MTAISNTMNADEETDPEEDSTKSHLNSNHYFYSLIFLFVLFFKTIFELLF